MVTSRRGGKLGDIAWTIRKRNGTSEGPKFLELVRKETLKNEREKAGLLSAAQDQALRTQKTSGIVLIKRMCPQYVVYVKEGREN